MAASLAAESGNVQRCVNVLIHQHKSLRPFKFEDSELQVRARLSVSAAGCEDAQRLCCYGALPGSTSGVVLTS